jgi:hypothetical protein
MSLDDHEQLVHVIIELFESTSPKIRASPLAQNGILRQFGYKFDTKIFKTEYKKIYHTDNFHQPDGIIRNIPKRISITCECKSGVSDEARILEQLRFFSEDPTFEKVFLEADEQNEILIVCLEDVAEATVNIVRELKINTNIVVWSVDMEPDVSRFLSQESPSQDERYLVKKTYGNHLDDLLDEEMESGIFVKPPTSHFLTDPYMPMPPLVAEMAERILDNVHTTAELDVDDFIANMRDVFIPNKKILKAISYVFDLIPKLGTITDDGKTILLRKLNARAIKEIQGRTEKIRKMSDSDLFSEVESHKKQMKGTTLLDFSDSS